MLYFKYCIFIAFRKVPSAQTTANKFVKNFLHLSPSTVTKRQTSVEDIVAVLDGSGSIGHCEFEKGKTALGYLMGSAKESKPSFDTQYAAVTFANSATVNFKFLKYAAAAANIMRIRYPGGTTNTQAGLNEALKLFRNIGSGIVLKCHVEARIFPILDKSESIVGCQLFLCECMQFKPCLKRT